MTTLNCPIEPHEMDKAMRKGFDDMLRRVVMLEGDRGRGHDFLLRIFLAGFHLGAAAQQRRLAKAQAD